MYTLRIALMSLLLAAMLVQLAGCGRELPHGTTTKTSTAVLPFPGGTILTALTERTNTAAGAPGVLLLPGSPADMDWNLGPLVTNTGILLARLLAMRGLRVLRYDPPGRGGSTLNDTMTPATAVAALLQCHRLLAAGGRPVWWIAHGDAALTALQAARTSSPRGIILIAPPGLPMGEVLQRQVRASLAARRVAAARTSATLAYLRAGIRALVEGKPAPTASRLVEEGAALAVARLHAPGQRAFARWMMGTAAPELLPPCPLQTVWGEYDRQYPATVHAPLWQVRRIPVRTIPRMDHMLRTRAHNPASLTSREVLQTYTRTQDPIPAALLDAICGGIH